ncbi:MAG: transposase [Candidatus Eisenbacteria bacterium]|nr:transposase [Candidatus Eisenbacteria bacterium]
MSEKRARRKFTAEEKAAMLRRHLVDKVPVSDLCEEYRIQPSLFYLWLRQAMENLSGVFQSGPLGGQVSPKEAALKKRISVLEETVTNREAKLAKKDRVIAEISAEYVQLKNELGEP